MFNYEIPILLKNLRSLEDLEGHCLSFFYSRTFVPSWLYFATKTLSFRKSNSPKRDEIIFSTSSNFTTYLRGLEDPGGIIHISQDQNGQDSLPYSKPRRNHVRTFLLSLPAHKLPQERVTVSLNRKQDRLVFRSI